MQRCKLNPIRVRGADSAVVFLHGFSGDRDDTWESFPLLVGTALPTPDIFTLGYSTTLLPDVAGVWSADPDLPILATQYRTHLGIPPLARYAALSLVAHSMGGLVVQRALVDDSSLCGRVRQVVLFGTPSGGLRKASWFGFWKRQLQNMCFDSEFILELRREWQATFSAGMPFDFITVAGAKDQFVPPVSSLMPFHARFHRVVPGNHLDIVKPGSLESESAQLLISFLDGSAHGRAFLSVAGAATSTLQPEVSSELRHAAEVATNSLDGLLATEGLTTQGQVVDAALALERRGRRADSVNLLESHLELGSDIKGTLGGRLKRMWLEEEAPQHAERAYELYRDALTSSRAIGDEDQIFYHAINLAFLELVAYVRPDKARVFASEALQHANRTTQNVWSLATRAESYLYLGDIPRALELYRELRHHDGAQRWQHDSAALQAFHVARALANHDLAEELDAIFSPGGSKAFVSYSHHDAEWRDRLRTMARPYMDDGMIEFWDDTQIAAGDDWRQGIQQAMAGCAVAVCLVSAPFLASDFIAQEELPFLIEAAERNRLTLLWVAVSPSGYDVTALERFQCTNDPKRPLSGLARHEQDQVLLHVARSIRKASQRWAQ